MEKLFSYGSLRDPAIQEKLFARQLSGTEDVLLDYEKGVLEIEGKRFNVANPKAGSTIEGMVYDLTPAELERADRYEGGRYKRIKVVLKSGVEAWLYLIK